jgi:hypothetical protein
VDDRASLEMARHGLRNGLNGPLSVLVPLVDLMLLEAAELELPLTVLKDLETLQRHLERLCRAAEVVVAADEVGQKSRSSCSLGHTASATGSRERATINGTVTEAMRDEVTRPRRSLTDRT